MDKLAIVIPAFKPTFLVAALESIAAQTDRAFTVYVGDDASRHDLAALCAPFAQRLRLNYVRFERNLGQTDLVAHWTRCIELSREPWVWPFSDDDVMDPECVGTLLDRIAGRPADADLFHFDVVQIDADGRDLRAAPPFPEEMSAMHFALARMERRISSYAPDYVFSRAAMQRVGGFQAFPVAWCSDDANGIKLAHRGGDSGGKGPKGSLANIFAKRQFCQFASCQTKTLCGCSIRSVARTVHGQPCPRARRSVRGTGSCGS